MKKLKVMIILALTVIFMLQAVGCGVSGIKGTIDKVDDAIDDIEEQIDDTNNTEDSTKEDTASSTFKLGIIDGSTYTNESIGIGFDLSEGWMFYDNEQLGTLNGFVIDSMDDEEIVKMIENSNTFFDMYAYGPYGTQTINICCENIGMLYGAILDESAYVDASLPTIQRALEASEYEDVECVKSTVNFAGKERIAIDTTANYGGVTVYEKQIPIKIGSYMVNITFASFGDNNISAMMDMFYTI